VINKATSEKSAGIAVTHDRALSGARVYVLSGTDPTWRAGTALTPSATNAFRYPMPAMSVSVLVME